MKRFHFKFRNGGPIIPPIIIMVVYATAVGTSVGAMFMDGIFPSILVDIALMIIVLLPVMLGYAV